MRVRGRVRKVIPGEWWVISDDSGQKFLASECKMTWDGKFVHYSEWDPKQPQLDIKGRDEKIAVSPTRPRGPDVFFAASADDV